MFDCVGRRVTALAEAFCILRGIFTMCVQLEVASIWFYLVNLIFRRKIQLIVFMLRVFTAHFSPVKCSKTTFHKRAKTLASYRGTIQSGNSIKCHMNAPDTYIKHQLSGASELSPNKYNIPFGFNHAPNPLTWRGYSRANVPCFNFLHCPLSARKMYRI